MMKFSLILISLIGAEACSRELHGRHHDRHLRRDGAVAAFPPVLDESERILVDSLVNSTISEWSYYFSGYLSSRSANGSN